MAFEGRWDMEFLVVNVVVAKEGDTKYIECTAQRPCTRGRKMRIILQSIEDYMLSNIHLCSIAVGTWYSTCTAIVTSRLRLLSRQTGDLAPAARKPPKPCRCKCKCKCNSFECFSHRQSIFTASAFDLLLTRNDNRVYPCVPFYQRNFHSKKDQQQMASTTPTMATKTRYIK